ncbi:ATP-binding protein [Selenomonas sp. WCA-380-WT-3B 3/]|uniref:ATP-binding protein n=1 Tax=Selenomonas montiformis TaxID=2652285 RepID=A0A6I2UWJ1_9FIRM|nr:ATP-binding protein [Selenomonas montiformis]MSV25597.1 ATP-binding protein [Selenomonas montiformis]
MYRLTAKLIIYRSMDQDSILFHLADICRRFRSGNYDRDALSGDILTEISRLLDVATRYGFDGNLWHNYLAFLLATTETPFTLVCEKHGASEGSVQKFARSDLDIFRRLLSYDFREMEQALGLNCFSVIEDYQAVEKKEQIYNKSVSEKVQELSAAISGASDGEDMYRIVTDFYRRYGVGMFGLNKAFRISPEIEVTGRLLEPVTTTGDMRLEDLVGYESQKKRLQENTEAFVAGRRANNVLLYGDAGTGKSTSIKAILNQYYDQGLRMIEVYKHEFRYLQRIIAQIKNRNYRFIIYMDDLSFEEFEIEYKYLKAVIEGGLEVKPDNVLIYATSNRRHLIRETWNDRPDHVDPDMHQTDTVQEKLSLSARFGLTIGYFRPSQQEYFEIVRSLARRHPELSLTDEELRAGAVKWEMTHSGISGRTAQQYINALLSGASGK